MMASTTLHSSPSRASSSSSHLLTHRPRWTTVLLALTCLAGQALALTPVLPADGPVETLLIDTRVPMRERGRWIMVSEQELELRKRAKRADKDGDVTTTLSIDVATVTEEPTSSGSSSSSSTSAAPFVLPSPLDGGLAANFTANDQGQTTCPTFLNSFLSNPTFKECYPLSLLLFPVSTFWRCRGPNPVTHMSCT